LTMPIITLDNNRTELARTQGVSDLIQLGGRAAWHRGLADVSGQRIMSIENRERLVLVVDDFEPNRDLYAYLLRDNGFRVELASNGQEGLDKAFELRPDVIIMDLSLPVLSGADATRQLKADERTRHIPVLIITAYDIPGAETALGCEAVLTKPCMPNVMLSEITRVLGEQSAK
jgi:two-component system, cell cycle response regulator DivK